jgi:hypothetical protein
LQSPQHFGSRRPRFNTIGWGAGKEIPLEIAVIDDTTGQPIASALVRVNHPFRPDLIPPKQGPTGADGEIKLTTVADARGRILVVIPSWEPSRHVVLRKTEHLSFSGGSIQVEANGYEPVCVPMSDEPSRSTTTIRLRPSRVPNER